MKLFQAVKTLVVLFVFPVLFFKLSRGTVFELFTIYVSNSEMSHCLKKTAGPFRDRQPRGPVKHILSKDSLTIKLMKGAFKTTDHRTQSGSLSADTTRPKVRVRKASHQLCSAL